MSLGKPTKNTPLSFSLKDHVTESRGQSPNLCVEPSGLGEKGVCVCVCVCVCWAHSWGEVKEECCGGGSYISLCCNRVRLWALLSTVGLSLGVARPYRRRRSLGEANGNPFQYSCLENSMDRGTWQATVHGVAKNQTQLRG